MEKKQFPTSACSRRKSGLFCICSMTLLASASVYESRLSGSSTREEAMIPDCMASERAKAKDILLSLPYVYSARCRCSLLVDISLYFHFVTLLNFTSLYRYLLRYFCSQQSSRSCSNSNSRVCTKMSHHAH